MKVSAIVLAVLLAILGISFGLVRMDVVDADLLRFLPALVALVLAGAVAYAFLRARSKKSKPEAKQ